MSEQQNTNNGYVSILDSIAYIIFAVAAIIAVIGVGSNIAAGAHINSPFSFVAGWDHTAMIVGGVIGMVVSAVLWFLSYLGKKSASTN